MNKNLLEETIECIKDLKQKQKDIIHIGNNDYSCTWKEFKKLADVEYDAGYGGQEIATDLRIIFKDGTQMYRAEYDGSEWWTSITPFKKPKTTKPIKALLDRNDLWVNLKKING